MGSRSERISGARRDGWRAAAGNTKMLNRVIEQRIGVAVQAALDGKIVTFHLDGGAPTYLTWREGLVKRRVISSGSRKGMEAMLPEVQTEFKRLLVSGSEEIEGKQGERRRDASSVG
jgi:hypothetical protein